MCASQGPSAFKSEGPFMIFVRKGCATEGYNKKHCWHTRIAIQVSLPSTSRVKFYIQSTML